MSNFNKTKLLPYKDFQDYVCFQFAKEEPTVLDDDFPDAFDNWICKLEPDDWLEYGNHFAKELR